MTIKYPPLFGINSLLSVLVKHSPTVARAKMLKDKLEIRLEASAANGIMCIKPPKELPFPKYTGTDAPPLFLNVFTFTMLDKDQVFIGRHPLPEWPKQWTPDALPLIGGTIVRASVCKETERIYFDL